MPDRAAWVRIDLTAIRHNIKVIRAKARHGARLCAVIKANGYGHGAVAMAQAVLTGGADYLAVAMLKEAAQLRDAGITAPILVLGVTPAAAAADVVERSVTQTVFSYEAAAALSAAAVRQKKIVKVHLKIDTGMRRIGVFPEAAGALAERIVALPNLEIEGIFSHFAKADCEDKAFAREQLERFRSAIRAVEARGISIPIKHLANSAAILELPEAHFDMIRAGIILYGLWPSAEVARSVELRPAFSLRAVISHVKRVPAGEPISYGGAFVTQRDSWIATLPVGYADGYTRLLSGKAMVEVRGRRAPVVGRICMDQCMIDVTDVAGGAVQAGEEVVLFGSAAVSVDDVADWIGTINYEVVCMVSGRVPRIYY